MKAPAMASAVQTTPPMISAAVMPAVPLSPALTSISELRISVISVMPDTGFVPTIAMALAATVVNRNEMTKTMAIAMPAWSQLSSSPKRKKMNVVASTAISTERISFIGMSRWVRSAVSAPARRPRSSVTASPSACRMMFDERTMPMTPAIAIPPIPICRA